MPPKFLNHIHKILFNYLPTTLVKLYWHVIRPWCCVFFIDLITFLISSSEKGFISCEFSTSVIFSFGAQQSGSKEKSGLSEGPNKFL
jgi:hypothetical protein